MKKTLFFSCVMTLGLAQVYGQIEVPNSLEQAIEHALQKSVSVKNQSYEIEKLELQRKGVLNKYIPRVEANALYAYLDNDVNLRIPSINTPITGLEIYDGHSKFSNSAQAFHAGLTAKFPIFTGFQIPNGARALEQKALGTQYLLEADKDLIIKDVINSFDQIYLLDQAEQLIQESETRLNKETQRVEKAISLGLAIPYDRDKIKYAALELENKKVDIHGKRKVLFQKLRYLTGYTDGEIARVQYELQPYIIVDSDLSAQNKQEIKALESFKSALDYLLKKEKGTYLPTVGAFAGVSYSSLFDATSQSTLDLAHVIHKDVNLKLNELTLSPNWMVGVALKWEIFSGFERKHKVEEAQINIAQMQNKIDDTKEKLELLLQHNFANYEVLLQKTEIAQQQEKIAQNNLKMAVKQYQEGLISISERLEAENDTYKAALNKVTTLIDQRLSAIETIMTTGELTQYISKNN